MSPHSLVVGGTRGLGRLVASRFAAEGHTVSVIGTRPPAEPAGKGSPRCWYVDLADEARLRATLDEILTAHGPPRSVVLTQRFRGQGDRWRGEIETALSATRIVIEHVTQAPAREGLSIVIVTSVAARLVASEQDVGYHVAKAGLEQMIRYYAVLLGPRGVRVNGVAPGTMIKPETAEYYERNPALPELLREVVPLGRMGTAEDVANVAAFLAGPEAGFVTGQVLTVDGGASLRAHESLVRQLRPQRPPSADA